MKRPASPHVSRAQLFAVLCVLCLLGAAGYTTLALLRAESAGRQAPSAATGDPAVLASVAREPHVLFVSTAVGETYGKIALVPLTAPDGPRYATALACERVYFAGGAGFCLGYNTIGGILSSYSAYAFDDRFAPVQPFQQGGIPSRVRISPDGRYAATTVFVTGHSYMESGFSTQTQLIDLRTGEVLADLEQFTVWRDGAVFQAVDFNFWGVTFTPDGDRFYATLASGGKTYLVEGDLAARQARVLRENVECPSLSPDGTRLAFKKRVEVGGRFEWRLHLLDLATLMETPLVAETRSIDDQVEWLDDAHLLYAFGEDGLHRTAATNIWVLAVDEGSPPRVFIPQGYSPAVVRAR
ncbi:MAG TPA: hypothetical protein VFB73_07375 [Chloroflexota bacterium]|nr:hypothetical protein [Chloroflexota bacterium]HZU05775.1 hypothetical protein [Chloroflexota bacterium]